MEHKLSLDKICDDLAAHGINITQIQYKQLLSYRDLIRNWSKRQNLIARGDLHFIAEKHFLPSLFLYSKLMNTSGKKIADIGSGAGFPGIILQIMNPHLSLTLIDSSRKKSLFLTETCQHLELNCSVICERIENYPAQFADRFDVTVSRAVGRLSQLWQWSLPILNKNGVLMALKGGDYQTEIAGLVNKNCCIAVISPEQWWKNLSDVLENNFIIRVEDQNE